MSFHASVLEHKFVPGRISCTILELLLLAPRHMNKVRHCSSAGSKLPFASVSKRFGSCASKPISFNAPQYSTTCIGYLLAWHNNWIKLKINPLSITLLTRGREDDSLSGKCYYSTGINMIFRFSKSASVDMSFGGEYRCLLFFSAVQQDQWSHVRDVSLK